MGVISAVARQLQPEDRVVYLQTDAPINPGNSGGARSISTDAWLVSTPCTHQSGGSEGLALPFPATSSAL